MAERNNEDITLSVRYALDAVDAQRVGREGELLHLPSCTPQQASSETYSTLWEYQLACNPKSENEKSGRL